MLVEQCNFLSVADEVTVKNDITQEDRFNKQMDKATKEIKKALLSGKLNYTCTKERLKEWFLHSFGMGYELEDIENTDLYYIAEECCNIKLMN